LASFRKNAFFRLSPSKWQLKLQFASRAPFRVVALVSASLLRSAFIPFQLLDTLNESRNLLVFLFKRGVDLFGPVIHPSRPAAAGLNQSALPLSPCCLRIETGEKHFSE
jgi:hypothetical protein